MSAAALLTLAASLAAAGWDERPLSRSTAEEFARVGASLRRSATFRRLEAGTARLPRRESRHTGLIWAVDFRPGARPALLFDAARLPALAEDEAAAQLALALARAELAPPLPLVEAEQAAWRAGLLALLELAAEDAAFSRALGRAYRDAEPRVAALARARAEPSAAPGVLPELPAMNLPEDALSRAGVLLCLLELDPGFFDEAVERGTRWPPGAARLAELEDLFALRLRELAALRAPPKGPYAALGGRRYSGALVRAAYRLRGTGELERLREGVGDEAASARELREALSRWRGARSVSP